MINNLIWSKDRACQLDLLLNSLNIFLPSFKNCVVYTTSNDFFEDGYQKLIKKYTDVAFVKESPELNFENSTKVYINNSQYVCLMTDDCVVFNNPPIDIEKAISNDDYIFSLRYGFNTVIQDYHTQRMQPLLVSFIDEGKTVRWNFNHYRLDDNYGYPFGLDGHIYNGNMLANLIQGFSFKKTNDLEGYLQRNCRHLIHPYIRSFKHSILVNIPCNVQSNITRAGETYSFTLEELNKKFLDGFAIDLYGICRESFIGSHQEVNFNFRKE